jgi:hypothetical protein
MTQVKKTTTAGAAKKTGKKPVAKKKAIQNGEEHIEKPNEIVEQEPLEMYDEMSAKIEESKADKITETLHDESENGAKIVDEVVKEEKVDEEVKDDGDDTKEVKKEQKKKENKNSVNSIMNSSLYGSYWNGVDYGI